MATFKQSLRNMHKSILSFINFVVGREEEIVDDNALPTQRNQYFT